ncbi:hypothetical protein A6U92_04960 [Agrobacterium rubi]|nr:hypothetical protein A6U92_04960 [Agrobacterium rubi]
MSGFHILAKGNKEGLLISAALDMQVTLNIQALLKPRRLHSLRQLRQAASSRPLTFCARFYMKNGFVKTRILCSKWA